MDLLHFFSGHTSSFCVLLSAICAYISHEEQKEDKLMTVRFHPPENQSVYADHVLALFVQAALPQIMEQLEQSHQKESQETETHDA